MTARGVIAQLLSSAAHSGSSPAGELLRRASTTPGAVAGTGLAGSCSVVHGGRGHGFDQMIASLRLGDLERRARDSNDGAPLPLRTWLDLAEAWRIAQALRENRGNRSATARALGIGRRTLYTKMEKLGLVPSWGLAARDEDSALQGGSPG